MIKNLKRCKAKRGDTAFIIFSWFAFHPPTPLPSLPLQLLLWHFEQSFTFTLGRFSSTVPGFSPTCFAPATTKQVVFVAHRSTLETHQKNIYEFLLNTSRKWRQKNEILWWWSWSDIIVSYFIIAPLPPLLLPSHLTALTCLRHSRTMETRSWNINSMHNL